MHAEPDGEQGVRVSVEDSGIGIAAAEAERIFRPFHRLHGEDRYEGSGIGLAICRRVVEAHGGRIWAEPRPEGGTAFRLTLPLAARLKPPRSACSAIAARSGQAWRGRSWPMPVDHQQLRAGDRARRSRGRRRAAPAGRRCRG